MATQIDYATIAGYFQPERKRINLCGHPLPIGVETMKTAFTHITIESKAFPRDEAFSANCDEASRQEQIARHGLDLLAALRGLLQITEKSMSVATIDRAICNAYEAITNATGKAPKF